jgi:flagellar motor protein MotB
MTNDDKTSMVVVEEKAMRQPLAGNKDEAGRAKNRRVELVKI